MSALPLQPSCESAVEAPARPPSPPFVLSDGSVCRPYHVPNERKAPTWPASWTARRSRSSSTDGVEQVELTEPRKALEEAGAETDARDAFEAGEVQGFNHLDKADTFPGRARPLADVQRRRLRRASCPGRGRATPTSCGPTRTRCAFVRAFFAKARKPLRRSATRRGRWSRPASSRAARSPRGRRLQTDLRNAGGTWVDEEVHVDQGLVTEPQARRHPGLQREGDRGVPPRARTRTCRSPRARADRLVARPTQAIPPAPGGHPGRMGDTGGHGPLDLDRRHQLRAGHRPGEALQRGVAQDRPLPPAQRPDRRAHPAEARRPDRPATRSPTTTSSRATRSRRTATSSSSRTSSSRSTRRRRGRSRSRTSSTSPTSTRSSTTTRTTSRPAPGGAKPYRLLLEAMRETGKVAIAKVVIRQKEHLVAIRPMDGDVLGDGDDDLRRRGRRPRGASTSSPPPTRSRSTTASSTIAKQLVESLVGRLRARQVPRHLPRGGARPHRAQGRGRGDRRPAGTRGGRGAGARPHGRAEGQPRRRPRARRRRRGRRRRRRQGQDQAQGARQAQGEGRREELTRTRRLRGRVELLEQGRAARRILAPPEPRVHSRLDLGHDLARDRVDLAPARGRAHELRAAVAGVGHPLDVAVALEVRDQLGHRLLGHLRRARRAR